MNQRQGVSWNFKKSAKLRVSSNQNQILTGVRWYLYLHSAGTFLPSSASFYWFTHIFHNFWTRRSRASGISRYLQETMQAQNLAPWPQIPFEICILQYRFALSLIRFLYSALSARKKSCKTKKYVVVLGTKWTFPSKFDCFRQENSKFEINVKFIWCYSMPFFVKTSPQCIDTLLVISSGE